MEFAPELDDNEDFVLAATSFLYEPYSASRTKTNIDQSLKPIRMSLHLLMYY
jgi:hypothetical protein